MIHAPLAPSGAPIWRYCAGSVKLQAQFPAIPTDDSKAGDAAHWVCSTAVMNPETEVKQFKGLRDPAGTLIDQEMIEAAEMFVQDVRKLIGPDLQYARIEQRVDCKRIHPTHNYGTPDFSLLRGNTLYVKDFKYGHGYVDEYENWQNIDYTAGLLDLYNIDGLADQNLFVEMSIIQPRFYHASPIRTWKVRASNLRGHFNILQTQGEKALLPNAEFTTGPHCRHCTGRRACPASRQASYNAIEVSTHAMPHDITPEALGIELDMLNRGIKAMEYMQTALMEQAEALIDQHKVVPGYAKQPSKGHACWKMDDMELINVGKACGYELQKKEAISPFQAKMLGIDESFIKSQTERPVSMKLKRVTANQIKKVFQNEQ